MLNKTGQFKDYIVYGSGQVLNLVAPFIIAPYVIAVSGMENWGRIGIALSVFTLLGIFIDFGSQLIGVKGLSINKGNAAKIKAQLDEVYTFRAIAFIVITVLLLGALLVLDLDYRLYLCGVAMLFSQFLNPLWIYQAFEEFTVINRIIILSKAIYLITVYVFVRDTDTYQYMLLCYGGANAAIYGFFLAKLYAKYHLSLFNVPVSRLVDNFRKEFPIVVSNFSISVYTYGPILIVGELSGEYLAGIYHVGDMLLKIIRSYLSVFFNVSFPKFCSAFNTDKEKGLNFLKTINKYHLGLLAFGLFMGYVIVLLLLERVSISKELHEGIVYGVKFLGIGFIIALNIPFYQLLIYYNKQKSVSVISVLGAIVMFMSCYLLTRAFNIDGSITSLYIVEVFITVSIIIVCYKKVFSGGLRLQNLEGNK